MLSDWHALGIEIPTGASGEVRALCPWCSESRKKKSEKCLAVNVDLGTYFCHHCGEAGSLRRAEGPRPAPQRPAYTRPDYQPAPGELEAAAQAWLVGRGITAGVWERNRIGFASGAITYPYFRGGEVINVKHRGRGKKFWLVAGAELLPYGLDDITPGAPLVWVEGEMDKLAVEVAGIVACVSVPNGAPSPGSKDTTHHFAYLDAAKPLLDRASRHVIAVDNDDAGRGLADELIRRLGRDRCWRVVWPGCKDANELLQRDGAAALAATLAAARPVPVAGLFEVEDFRDAYLDLYEHGMDGGEHPGCAALAPHYRVKPGSWTLLTGIPSHGKSAFLDWLLMNLAQRAGWQIAIFSPENQPIQRHIANLAQILAGQPFDTRRPGAMDRETAEATFAALHEHFQFILPPEGAGWGIDTILNLARAAVYRRGIRGLVIDPWNELEHLRPPGVTETEHVSTVLTQIRRFARTYGVHVWLVAHPTKLQKDAHGEYPVPTPYDISGCYSEDTEVLTRNGWKRHDEWDVGEEILTFDLDRSMFTWDEPTHQHIYDHAGPMVRLKSPSTDVLVTPNHRMVVKPAWKHEPKDADDPRIRPRGWHFIEASEIRGSELYTPFANPTDEDRPDSRDYPLYAGKEDDVLRFLGWWISEGYITYGSIGMCQAEGPMAQTMRATMDRLGMSYASTINPSRRANEQPMWAARLYKRQHPEFCNWVVANCGHGALTKRLPDLTWALSKRQQQVLLDALVEGDGNDRTRSGVATDNRRYCTISPQLADDVQRLAVMLGHPAGIHRMEPAKAHHNARYSVEIGRTTRRTLIVNRKRNITTEQYVGKVYCFTVPTGAYLTRRNGKIAVQGNSAHFRNKADMALCVWRDVNDAAQPTQIHIQKVRFRESGELGMVKLYFDTHSGRYREYPVERRYEQAAD